MRLLIEALPIFIGMPSCHRIGGQEEWIWSVLIWWIFRLLHDYWHIHVIVWFVNHEWLQTEIRCQRSLTTNINNISSMTFSEDYYCQGVFWIQLVDWFSQLSDYKYPITLKCTQPMMNCQGNCINTHDCYHYLILLLSLLVWMLYGGAKIRIWLNSCLRATAFHFQPYDSRLNVTPSISSQWGYGKYAQLGSRM